MQNQQRQQSVASSEPILSESGIDSDLAWVFLEIQLTGWHLKESSFCMELYIDYTKQYSEVNEGEIIW